MASLRSPFRALLRGLIAATAIVAPLAAAAPVRAQSTAYPAITEVDPASALSRYLRMLASNPRDLASLTGAGRAALAVGDANAALGFYARAEELSPRNGRIKAGLASALVQMEQPRAALKLFGEAVTFGVPVGEIAADRGLANDLLGDNRRAQADYTIALRTRSDDETVRRLALSMAVSGDRDGALAILSPLLQRRDGGAERARAFVLALTGDQAGAAGAVRAAMPGAQANAMLGFMNRLATLNPAQKALAVNFGYFPSDGRAYTAAELFADARAAPLPSPGSALGARDPRRDPRADTPLIPFGEALGPRLASNEAVSVAPRRRPGQEEVLPPPHVLSAPIPGVTAIPSTRRPATVDASASPIAPSGPLSTTAGVAAAAAPQAATGSAPPPGGTPQARPAMPSASASAASPVGPLSQDARGGPAVSPAPQAASPAAGAEPASPDAARPIGYAPGTTRAVALPVASAPARIATVELPAATARTPGPQVEPVQPLRTPPARPEAERSEPVRSATPARATPSPRAKAVGAAAEKPPVQEATTKGRVKGAAVRSAATETGKDDTAKGVKLASLDPKTKKPLGTRSGETDETHSARNGRSRTTAGDDEAAKSGKTVRAGTKGKADAGKADTDASKAKSGAGKAKAAAEASETPAAKGKAGTKGKAGDRAASDAKDKSAAKQDRKEKADTPATPERFWVQVASGSNKAHLDKAWAEVKGKAPKQLSGQTTYTAPWRASNRLLIGPFKSAEAAQAKVNSLAKSGVAGIQFTTRAGAEVEKIATK